LGLDSRFFRPAEHLCYRKTANIARTKIVSLPNSGPLQGQERKGEHQNGQGAKQAKPQNPKNRMAELWKTISVTRFFKKPTVQIIY
jgi:hypothetical protein